MSAEPLTLESLGVDLSALAGRIAAAQSENGLTDDEAARRAGVSVDRWRGWKENRERPGVGRVPKLAAALNLTVPALLFGMGDAPAIADASPTDYARRAAQAVTDLVRAVDTVARIAGDIYSAGYPVPGGDDVADALRDAAQRVMKQSARVRVE